jgi:hypothetical protein
MIDMVPKGYLNKIEIKKFWAIYKEETRLTEIKLAEYQVINVSEVALKQNHLTQSECDQLENALLDFQPLF